MTEARAEELHQSRITVTGTVPTRELPPAHDYSEKVIESWVEQFANERHIPVQGVECTIKPEQEPGPSVWDLTPVPSIADVVKATTSHVWLTDRFGPERDALVLALGERERIIAAYLIGALGVRAPSLVNDCLAVMQDAGMEVGDE